MPGQQWDQVQELCHQALRLAPEERSRFLHTTCATEPRLLAEVESLLAFDDVHDGFLESSALDVVERTISPANSPAPGSAGPGQVGKLHIPLLGRTISRYRILEKLGDGGMGVVYKAEDTILHRFVALKFLSGVGGFPNGSLHDNAESCTRQALLRVQREARASSALDHPNICTIYEVDQFEEVPFIAMQLLSGQTLAEKIGGRPLPPASVLEYGTQIADALTAAHAAGILHRDIKPANIFITLRGAAKVLDFGLARPVIAGPVHPHPDDRLAAVGDAPEQSAESSFPTDSAFGTPSYMSPEQALGSDIDERADIFSLGAVLYEMATGAQAFPTNFASLVAGLLLPVPQLRPSEVIPGFPAALEYIIFKALERDRDLRYQTAAELREALTRVGLEHGRRADDFPIEANSRGVAILPSPPEGGPLRAWNLAGRLSAGGLAARFGKRFAVLSGAALLLVAGAVLVYFHLGRRPSHRLAEDDTIVLADFVNTTGDRVFDDALKQALRIQLEQSPFLSVLSDRKAKETLAYMGLKGGQRLSGDTAREVCIRSQSKAMLAGSIAPLGGQYLLSVTAINCQTDEVLDSEQVEAESRERVIRTLGDISKKLRRKLGESFASVGRYDVPLEQVTTPSLEALQAYSLGVKAGLWEGDAASVPLFRQATTIDPDFAMAYARLSVARFNLNEPGAALASIERAYALRGRISEREKLGIEARYYMITGQIERAIEDFEMLARLYPRELTVHTNLGMLYSSLGRHRKSLDEFTLAAKLDPANGRVRANIASAYANLNQLAAAEQSLQQAASHNVGNPAYNIFSYDLAFARGDSKGMEEHFTAAMGQPGWEGMMLATRADTESYFGRLANARDFSARAVDSAHRYDNQETSTGYAAVSALRDVEFGDTKRAVREANEILATRPGTQTSELLALTLARAGEVDRALLIEQKLTEKFPLDTMLTNYWSPTIRAAVALARQNPSQSIAILRAALPYELGTPRAPTNDYLHPIYLRGMAYLANGQGYDAAKEFEKVIANPGIIGSYPLGALAHLGLARAYALQAGVPILILHGNPRRLAGLHIASSHPSLLASSILEYKTFLSLWRDADADVPILLRAREEYRSLN